MKAEAVYTKDRLTTVTDPLDFDGLAKTDELRYLIGVDWVIDEHTVNAQFFQTWFQDHRRTMIADRGNGVVWGNGWGAATTGFGCQ